MDESTKVAIEVVGKLGNEVGRLENAVEGALRALGTFNNANWRNVWTKDSPPYKATEILSGALLKKDVCSKCGGKREIRVPSKPPSSIPCPECKPTDSDEVAKS